MRKVLPQLFCLVISTGLFGNKKLIEQYVQQYKDIAIREMRSTGIPASIKLAQGLLESDWGRSDLANKANNHFGIKCGRDWTGDTFMKYDDDSDEEGMLVESCFRVFSSAEESYRAHSEFLLNPAKKSRYGFLFEYPATDYVSWANGLKFAGYATDPKYPEKLIRLIETYQLYKYDEPVLIKPAYPETAVIAENSNVKKESEIKYPSDPKADKSTAKIRETASKENTPALVSYKRSDYRIQSINDIPMVKAIGKESLESLAKALNMDVYDLIEYNEKFDSKDILLPAGTHVYLNKKKRVNKDAEWHKVQEGESMFYISQQYGLRLESLYARNNMDEGTEPYPGEKISLKKHVSKKDTPKHRKVDHLGSVFINMGNLK